MPEPQSSRAARAVNPQTSFELSILDLIECGLAVAPRPDLGGVELRIRDREQVTVLIVGPEQAMAVAKLLIAAVATVDREEMT